MMGHPSATSIGNKMNDVQTRVPGRRDPKTAIGGHRANTAHAYQAWSATAADMALPHWSANHVTVHIAVAKRLQFQADNSVVSRSERRPPTTISEAAPSPTETTACQKPLNPFSL